ncbi:MAG: hypothetical protein ABIY55_24690 [Kofleriaceae bacterium]
MARAGELLAQVAHLVGRSGEAVDADHTDLAIADEVEWITGTHACVAYHTAYDTATPLTG